MAPIAFRACWQNTVIASAARGSLASRASRSRTSALVSETPSSPDSRFTGLSNWSAVRLSARRRKSTSGARSPVRVPITKPPVGVNPTVVSTHLPP